MHPAAIALSDLLRAANDARDLRLLKLISRATNALVAARPSAPVLKRSIATITSTSVSPLRDLVRMAPSYRSLVISMHRFTWRRID